MSTHSRHKILRHKSRTRLAEAKQLARVNPDALARNLLRWRDNATNHQQRREIWNLLQNLGGDAAVRRAAQTIERSRSGEELEAVLRAAAMDLWFEAVPALTRRFHREVMRPHPRTPPVETWSLLHSMAFAAGRLGAPLPAADIRRLLKDSSARLRAAGAEIVALQERTDLLAECLPLCWDHGEASLFAGEVIGKFGDSDHAAALWAHALSARKSSRDSVLRRLIHVLGMMGAFDIQLGLRTWIEEDFAEAGKCAWHYGQVWSRLVGAKLAAGACNRDEALADLRWFLHAAGSDTTRGFGGYGAELGPFCVARQLVRLGARAEAEEVLLRYAACGLPPPAEFPELLFPGLRDAISADRHGHGLGWLAAMGDAQAQTRLLESWREAFGEGRWPQHWDIRSFLDPEQVLAILRDSLRVKVPGLLRQVLGLLMGDSVTIALRPEIEALAAGHSSALVRWKARRLLKYMARAKSPAASQRGRGATRPRPLPQRWVRMDAAVLAGAIRPGHLHHTAAKRKAPAPNGLHAPLRPGQGWTLVYENLSQTAREATVKALCKAPLDHALHRRVPLGPAYEDRPDIRALRELAAPENEIDERMGEMARAVMSYWSDGDEPLTLDEEGVALVATGLSADVHILDEDDVAACGAFVGEALRRRLGGQWTGFDDNYVLDINGEVLDPIGWAREIYARRDVVEGARQLTDWYNAALRKLAPPPGYHYHPDPTTAFELSIKTLCALPLRTPMQDLLAQSRVLSYRLETADWPRVFEALDLLLTEGGGSGVRAVAAVAIYAPSEIFGRAWSRWGRRRRESTGIADAMVEAIQAAVTRDDLEAMPDWTTQPQQSRFSFLNPLRKRMKNEDWRKALLLLLRQRAAAGDRLGVSWCLYSYKYEFPDVLKLIELYCDMSVSARQTVLRATFHCTRDERKLFRPLWAEGLRDPSPAVVIAALNAANIHHARSLRPLVVALKKDSREDLAVAAEELLRIWQG